MPDRARATAARSLLIEVPRASEDAGRPRLIVIVGGGIAGLAAAHRAKELARAADVAVLEGAGRLGGKIATERLDGFVVEGGPDCFLAAKPAGIALCRALGLEPRLQGADPRFRRSYLKRNGLLHPLPDGLSGLAPSRIWPLVTTRILSLPGRVRAALELFAPTRVGPEEESVAHFVTRRFGAEAYHWLVEPLLAGIYAGDGAALSLEATFPQLKQMERAHGSVLRAMWRAKPARPRDDPFPTGFVTLAGGLRELVLALEGSLAGIPVFRGIAARTLAHTEGGYALTLGDGRVLTARAVLLATPAFATAEIVDRLDSELAAVLREIPFASTVTVSVAFPRSAIPNPLRGYGYVSPRAEGGSIVACTWTSNKFPGRAPADGVLLRFFLGRAEDQPPVARHDEELKAAVRKELKDVLGIAVEPAFWRIYRWPRALPQYVLGHRDRLHRIERRLAEHRGLVVAGCSYYGVGIPDCIASGRAAAEAALAATG